MDKGAKQIYDDTLYLGLKSLGIKIEEPPTGRQLYVDKFIVGDREPDRDPEWLLRNLVMVLRNKTVEVEKLVVQLMDIRCPLEDD
jgi:hypothetical protein